ncbi:hypothetical protein FQN57_000186 [Myotisia sp. PD_48]|nr:hypothetical protein FQN57_000186 [Myotisia sp. PD_48]
MIIYKDVFTDDEILSDIFQIKEVDEVFWEVDCKKYVKKKNQDFALEGANPSAEEGGDDYGGDDDEPGVMVHDIEESFLLNWLKPDDDGQETKPSKDDFKAHLKKYVKNLSGHLKKTGASEEEVTKFQKAALAGFKKLVANYDNYDFMMGASMNPDGIHCATARYVLIDFREDGITPYATIWKHGVTEMKV